jgi:predicted nucleic acid-binding protein
MSRRRAPPGRTPCPMGLRRDSSSRGCASRSRITLSPAHGFSYWDAAIIAAARALGCGAIYTEDLSHGRTVEGVAIVNPFR